MPYKNGTQKQNPKTPSKHETKKCHPKTPLIHFNPKLGGKGDRQTDKHDET